MTAESPMPSFCTRCGGSLRVRTIAGDNQDRFVCDDCGQVRYDNPNVLVVCIATWGDEVLWIQRGNEPRKGYWALPGGFMEMGESPEEAVVREFQEETNAAIEPSSPGLYMVGSLPDISEVHLLYRAQLLTPEFECTEEAIDIALLDAASAPWDRAAYPDVLDVMHTFYADHAKREYGIYSAQYKGRELQFIRIGIAHG